MAFPTPLTATLTTHTFGTTLGMPLPETATFQATFIPAAETLSLHTYAIDDPNTGGGGGGTASTRPTTGLIYPRGFS